MNPTSRTFRVGDRVRITNVGCDCEPFSDVCDRHQYVGDIVTIVDIYDEDDEPMEVYYVDSTADTGADERLAHPPKSGGAGAPAGSTGPTNPDSFRPSQTKGTPSGNAS